MATESTGSTTTERPTGACGVLPEELAFLDRMSYAFTLNGVNPVARPCGSPDVPAPRTEATLYGIAGGLPFYSPSADAESPGGRVGGPGGEILPTCSTGMAGPWIARRDAGRASAHQQRDCWPEHSFDRVVDPQLPDAPHAEPRHARSPAATHSGRIFPARAVGVATDGAGSSVNTHWAGVPFASLVLETTAEMSASSWSSNQWAQIPESGQWAATHATTEFPRFFRARGVW